MDKSIKINKVSTQNFFKKNSTYRKIPEMINDNKNIVINI